MKNGWETMPLADLCEVFDDGDWVESKDQSIEGVRLIQTGNVGEGVFKDRIEKARYVSEATFKRLKCTEVFRGDCLISRLPDPVGRTCILPETGERMITAVDCTIVRFKPKLLLPAFFNYFSQSDKYLSTVEKECTGTTRSRISRNNLGLTPIPVPSLVEQERIVGILDEAFEGIASAKANAEQNLRNARALFESHLQYVFTHCGEPWEVQPLERLAAIRTGKRDANHQVESGPYPFYTCAFGQFKSPTFSFDGPSIILPGNGANVGKVFFHDGKFEAYQRTYVVNELSQSINPRFLYFCFSANWAGWIATKQFGAATNYIVVGDLKAFSVPTPPLPVQEATVEQLQSFSDETKCLESIYLRKLAALGELKKSLLHQAFSGKL